VLLVKKAAGFFARFNGHIVARTANLGDQPAHEKLIGTVKVMLDAYDEVPSTDCFW